MKNTFIQLALAVILLTRVSASSDSFAAPLYSETRFNLPSPYDSGRIIASAEIEKVKVSEIEGGIADIVKFLSLKIEFGDSMIDIPPKVLGLFPGPNLSSLQFFVGPPDDPMYPINSIDGDPNLPTYFLVTFRHGSWPYDSDISRESGPTASIVIREDQIVGLSSGLYNYPSRNFDPQTLKEIDREQNAAQQGAAANP